MWNNLVIDWLWSFQVVRFFNISSCVVIVPTTLGTSKIHHTSGIYCIHIILFKTITNVVFVQLLMSTLLLVFPLPIFSQHRHSSMSRFVLQPQLIFSLKKWNNYLFAHQHFKYGKSDLVIHHVKCERCLCLIQKTN